MKIEKEIKIYSEKQEGIDLERLRRALADLGAEPMSKGVVHEFGYKSPDLKKRGITTLRLRVIDGKAQLTVKMKKIPSRLLEREEYEIGVSDLKEAEEILKKLVAGLFRFRRREKEREKWVVGDVDVCIDRYAGFPAYVEIEAKSLAEINATIRKLGLSRYRRTTKTSTELLRMWGAKDPNHIKF